TDLVERLGETRAQDLLRGHCALVREQLAAHGGFEVKTQGDGFMIGFPCARAALRCAGAIQRAMVAYGEHAAVPVSLRIGLHTGEATREGDDFFGRSVIVAARIAAAAAGGEILVSSVARELAGSNDEFVFDAGREFALKGFNGTRHVYALDWAAGVPSYGMPAKPTTPRRPRVA